MPLPGVYGFRIRARGETLHGEPFEREQTLTGVAVAGGDHWSPEDPLRDPLCELVDCLRRQGTINDELLKRLRAFGLDLEALLRCLGKRCEAPGDEGRPQEKRQTTLASLNPQELLDAMTAVLRQRDST